MDNVMLAETAAPGQRDWVAHKKRIAITPGCEIAYVEWGDLSAQPVLLIHGFSDSSRAWSLPAPYLKGRRFLAVDLPGHGDSDSLPFGQSIQSMSDAMAAMLLALEIETAEVVGHSMGSMVAAMLAANHPDRVSRLVLVSTALRQPGTTISWILGAVESNTYPVPIDGAFMQEWTWNPHPVDPVFLELLKEEVSRTPYMTWRGCALAIESLDLTSAVGRITAPTLIVYGDQDQLMSLEDQKTAQAHIPGAELKIYEGYGHSITWELPEIAAQDLMAFLSR